MDPAGARDTTVTQAAGRREWLAQLRSGCYRRDDALWLIGVAGDAQRDWQSRNLAVLLLEHLILLLPAEAGEEFDFLLCAMGLKDRPGRQAPVSAALRRDGYAATDLDSFIIEFRRRLQRQWRLHECLRQGGSDADLWDDLVHLARQDCRLTLSRYLIKSEDVVGRISSMLRCSRGVSEPLSGVSPQVLQEARASLARLPELEAAIAARLCASGQIYWSSPATPATLNALVECPLGTVVTVIKPPGSCLEFEIKRTGMRHGPVWDVCYARDAGPVPESHRLQGGNMGSLLLREARAAAVLGHLYRCVHGYEAPSSRLLALKTVYALPTQHGEVQLLDYFSEAKAFGAGFPKMRSALAAGVAAFEKNRTTPALAIGGVLGLSSRFLAEVAPKQGIFVHTSSYRLDRLAGYLSPDGADRYFENGQGIAVTSRLGRRLAEDLLEELLGVYTPPPAAYRRHQQFLDEAFEVEENKTRAKRCFAATMEQLGRLWGTVLAARGHSTGESFVARNIGLKSVWEAGRWRVKLLFMDHDNLNIGHRQAHFHPLEAVEGTSLDGSYIFGWEDQIKGSVTFLQEIYRQTPAEAGRGCQALLRAARSAYQATQAAILGDARLRPFFDPLFGRRLADWDHILAAYFRRARDLPEEWQADTRSHLRRRDYSSELIDEYVKAAPRYALLLPQLERILCAPR